MPVRKREELHPAERRERSEACRSWVEHYGHDFRTAQGCGKDLARLQGARGRGAERALIQYGDTVARCAFYLNDIVKRNAAHGISAVASCVRSGYSHGVTQTGWRPKKQKKQRK